MTIELLQQLNENIEKLREEVRQVHKFLDTRSRIPSTPLILRQLATEDSARYVYENFPQVLVFTHRHETVKYAAQRTHIEGLVLEFGVHKGETINQISRYLPKRSIFGFDSFRGLPEDWGGTGLLEGRFDESGQMPNVAGHVTLVPGWFNESIPVWKEQHQEAIAFCHVDSDLYSSAVTIFTELEERFRPGTVILFDEYFGYSDWRNGEHKAFLEMIDRTGFTYEPLAISHQGFVVELGAQVGG